MKTKKNHFLLQIICIIVPGADSFCKRIFSKESKEKKTDKDQSAKLSKPMGSQKNKKPEKLRELPTRTDQPAIQPVPDAPNGARVSAAYLVPIDPSASIVRSGSPVPWVPPVSIALSGSQVPNYSRTPLVQTVSPAPRIIIRYFLAFARITC